MSDKPEDMAWKARDGQVVRVDSYVEVLTRHKTRCKGTVVSFRDNRGHCPDTIVLKMDEDTVYADVNRLPGWPHDQQRIAELGVFGGEIVRVITKTLH